MGVKNILLCLIPKPNLDHYLQIAQNQSCPSRKQAEITWVLFIINHHQRKKEERICYYSHILSFKTSHMLLFSYAVIAILIYVVIFCYSGITSTTGWTVLLKYKGDSWCKRKSIRFPCQSSVTKTQNQIINLTTTKTNNASSINQMAIQ